VFRILFGCLLVSGAMAMAAAAENAPGVTDREIKIGQTMHPSRVVHIPRAHFGKFVAYYRVRNIPPGPLSGGSSFHHRRQTCGPASIELLSAQSSASSHGGKCSLRQGEGHRPTAYLACAN
jgi:hypothetical protein